MTSLKLSIIVATHNRAECVGRMLASLRSSVGDFDCEIILAVNGNKNDETQEVVNRGWQPLKIRVILIERAGKSVALNRALEDARGDMVAFLDDDVTVPAQWLDAYLHGFGVHANAKIFCGPIVPLFPVELPTWILQHPYSSIMFADFQPRLSLGPLPLRWSPLGPNFVAPADLLRRAQFRIDLGPSEAFGALMCEDTELLQRLRSMFSAFNDHADTIFVPGAYVHHHLAGAKISSSAMAERFFALGRSHVIRFGRVTHLSRPARFSSKLLAPKEELLALFCQVNFYIGQMHQFQLQGRTLEATFIGALLSELNIDQCLKYLGPSARLAIGEVDESQSYGEITASGSCSLVSLLGSVETDAESKSVPEPKQVITIGEEVH